MRVWKSLVLLMIMVSMNSICLADERATKINIAILTNITEGKFIGDMNHALGIQNALSQKIGNERVKKLQFDINNIEQMPKQLSNNKSENILIAIGTHGIKAIKELSEKDLTNKITIVWSGHQYLNEVNEIINIADIISLPDHLDVNSMNYKQGKAKLVKTSGLAHNLNIRSSKLALNLDKFNIPESNKYIAIFLGGDAPKPDGTMLYFTPEQATELAKNISPLLPKDATVLITNSPRTGRFDPKTGNEVSQIHRSETVDLTSKAFINTLKNEGIKIYFENFVFGEPSAYSAFLYLANMSNGMAFVTGDSTSMISEVADNIEYGNLYVLSIPSMNETHKAHISSLYSHGVANIVDGKNLMLSKAVSATTIKPAAEVIADATLQILISLNLTEAI